MDCNLTNIERTLKNIMPLLSALSELERRVGELNRTIQEMQIKAHLGSLALEELKLSYSQSAIHNALLQLRIDAMQNEIEQFTKDTVDKKFNKLGNCPLIKISDTFSINHSKHIVSESPTNNTNNPVNVINSVKDGQVVDDPHSFKDTEFTNFIYHDNTNNNNINNNNYNNNKNNEEQVNTIFKCSNNSLNLQSNSSSCDRSYFGRDPPTLTLPPSTGQLNTPMRPEDNQIFIRGFMEPEDDASIDNLAYVVLRTVYPTLGYDDIREAQGVRARGRMSVGHDLGDSAPQESRRLWQITINFSDSPQS